VGLGLRRIACTQAEAAIRCLTQQPGQANGSADKILGAQAALVLLELDLPRAVVRRDRGVMIRLRESLTQMHQPAVLLARLEARYKKSPSDKALASAVKALRKQWTSETSSELALNTAAGSFNPLIYRLVADMAELRGNIGYWPIENTPDNQPPRGLRRAYSRAQKRVVQPITREGLTDLIPRLALLEKQLSLVNKVCPGMIKPQRKLLSRAVEELDALREDDALDSVLRKELGKASSASLSRAEPIAKRSASVLVPDVTNAMAESPSAFIKRITVYWSAWRSDTSADAKA